MYSKKQKHLITHVIIFVCFQFGRNNSHTIADFNRLSDRFDLINARHVWSEQNIRTAVIIR